MGLLFAVNVEVEAWHSFAGLEWLIIAQTARGFARTSRDEGFLPERGQGADVGD